MPTAMLPPRRLTEVATSVYFRPRKRGTGLIMSTDSPKRKTWVGFDLGGTKMMAVVFDDKLKVLGKKRRKTRGNAGEQVGLERLAETITMALTEAGVTAEEIVGIGAGVPGPLDLQKGIILEAPNLGWKNVDLQDFLSKRFKCPAMICNDVDAGVFGEYSSGAGQGARCVLGVFPGTGIGGGCVYEGRIFRGSRSSCMEVGFLQMATSGAAAGVGPVGRGLPAVWQSPQKRQKRSIADRHRTLESWQAQISARFAVLHSPNRLRWVTKPSNRSFVEQPKTLAEELAA
jgi:hypothetical protein